eukprot:gnl/TRDRNA2_/TRDRNA2_134662_c0_seq1.p1 gnl/TRDRNA2_/TRDRNA2_134662_c0~~gnl/TRDRNA2_/TRDRNA2_134662_c0_seq1.p1  ORF type:complete len:466 (+),score=61.35 gnl/TRDRNA2_/TRDRNA2_134662_c0_seq1:29-1399(+)
MILNAMALEFIFDFDDLIVQALLSKNEQASMSIMLVHNLIREHSTQFFRSVQCEGVRIWRLSILLRMLLIFLLSFSIMLPRHFLVHSLHQRALALCISSGVINYEAMPDDDPNEVVFPVRGFCDSLLDYVGVEGVACRAWKFRNSDPMSYGMCSAPGYTGSAEDLPYGWWWSMMSVDAEVLRLCGEFWFGLGGSDDGKRVPAMRREDELGVKPDMFGCRIKDLHVDVQPEWFWFKRLRAKCTRPAFGPLSAAWNSTPLDSEIHVGPRDLYSTDPRASIEWQADACAKLPKFKDCNKDSCNVLATGMQNRSCNEYCVEHDLVCKEAHDENENSCVPKKTIGCDHRAANTHDLLCHCTLPDSKRVCGKLPNAFHRCDGDPCRVLVAKMDLLTGEVGAPTSLENCNTFCAVAGLACAGQYEVMKHTCNRMRKLSCSDKLAWEPHSVVPVRECECHTMQR